jgi:hypothetical protein
VLDDLERRKLVLRTPQGWVQVEQVAGDSQQPLPLR